LTRDRRQPAAVVGAKLVLVGALAWAIWNVIRAELGE
jgi:hypothetical protein